MHDGLGPVGRGAVGRWGSGVRWEVGKQGSKRRGAGRWGHGTAGEEELGVVEEGGMRTRQGEEVRR